MDSTSEFDIDSDASSIDGAQHRRRLDPELLQKRLESVIQENVVLKTEIDTCKLKIRGLQEENLQLRKNSVNIQARAEQEEEYISNKLMKKISELKKEKESLALTYEQEEEYLTNDLSRKLIHLKQEKATLEQALEKEQEQQKNTLLRRVEKLEREVGAKQELLDRLRVEKVDLENALEQEQEALVNKLWRKMEKLESEKRLLQEKLDSAATESKNVGENTKETISEGTNCEAEKSLPMNKASSNVLGYIGQLRNEVAVLREQLSLAENARCGKAWEQMETEEKILAQENIRLRKRLQHELEVRRNMCRYLSESESSLEIDEERQFNEVYRRMGALGPDDLQHLKADSYSRRRERAASGCSSSGGGVCASASNLVANSTQTKSNKGCDEVFMHQSVRPPCSPGSSNSPRGASNESISTPYALTEKVFLKPITSSCQSTRNVSVVSSQTSTLSACAEAQTHKAEPHFQTFLSVNPSDDVCSTMDTGGISH